ncbi:MAG TPA: hypothetical protein VER32_05275 [Pyrinomonadaceae bacterium]|nr:hypothetical protein [Pyrinomonadaceae bacterium]
MQFSQSGTEVPQLYFAADNGDAAPRTLLYLLPQDATDAPAAIAFADSWSSFSGTYVFLEAPLPAGTESAFASAAWAYLADPRESGARFAWLGALDASGILAGTTVAVSQPQGKGADVTSFPVSFALGSVSLGVPAGTTVSPDAANFAFTFTPPAGQTLSLLAAWGAHSAGTTGASLTLPFTTHLAGCLLFTLQLTEQNQTDLDVSLRYFYAEPLDAANPGATSSDGSFFLASLRYPVFAQTLALYASLDPLAPLAPARTFLAFNGADAGQAGEAAAVASNFSSTLGDQFSLVPLTGAAAPTGFAALVFAANRQASAPTPQDPLYLVPAGDFTLQTTRAGTVDMMCGLSGVEYVQLNSGGASIVSFFPGGAAYGKGFYPGQPPGYTEFTTNTPPTTSYAFVSQAGASSGGLTLAYYAQPDQSILYNYNLSPPPGVQIPALAAVPVHAATLAAPASANAFPLLPYAGLGGQDLAPLRQMESQVVSPARRLALKNSPPAATATARPLASADPAHASTDEPPAPMSLQSSYSTTPQGLLATYVAGGSTTQWDEIVLAQMGETQQFLFKGVSGDLLSAFQSNKLFLVISDPVSVEPYLLKDYSRITIGADASETWNFELNPAPPDSQSPSPWTNYGTIIIVKFFNQSLSDLAGQTGSWSAPATFNKSPADTSAAIKAIIAEAEASSDPDFATFLDAVQNPSWNGVLMLNAMAPVQELPPELAGLAVGIDQSKFFAHHVGINASLINVPASPADLSISDSSIFGLINYKAPQALGSTDLGYQFQVEQLKVLFLNSDVAGFSSIIDLQINSLFGEPAALENRPDNVLRMYGVYQKHVVGGQVQESYIFQTKADDASVFDMGSDVLNAVEITKGQFVTVTSEDTATETASQFVLWGLLDFKALGGFDLFSFGRPTWQVAAAPSGAVRASGTTTVTTAAPHGLSAGNPVTVYGVADKSFNGTFAVTSVTPQSFTYAQAGLADSTSGGGAAVVTTPSGLNFGNLVIDMNFNPEALPALPTFAFDASQLSFDMADSVARDGSFFNHFPLTVNGFTQAEAGVAPTDLGFMGLQTPLAQSALVFPWYSLNFNLNLGSPGALAAQAGFVATLGAAWSPTGGGASYKVFTGLKLPGSSGSKRAITIEGIFDITFKTLEIVALPDKNAYILVLYNIGFKFLSFTFPPTGQVNFVLFGDPGQSSYGAGGDTTLGWYAAYAKPQANPQKPNQNQLPNNQGALPPASV